MYGTAHPDWTAVGPPDGAAGPLAKADWGRFHAEYLAEVYRLWSQAAGSGLPVIVNLNPPTVPELDDWLARVRPELWGGGISYGFTNWMGVVSQDHDAHARHVIAAKRAPGPNLEENWGFSQLYLQNGRVFTGRCHRSAPSHGDLGPTRKGERTWRPENFR
ncbi:hypothetical protein ABGB18_15240 [Nonomuraea sp. B12E4]|uniref:hypothetical protein n=1 Tax=Nonomuraea sp. B12E4 TaxID=3153564 RepID=UPI00325CE32B